MGYAEGGEVMMCDELFSCAKSSFRIYIGLFKCRSFLQFKLRVVLLWTNWDAQRVLKLILWKYEV